MDRERPTPPPPAFEEFDPRCPGCHQIGCRGQCMANAHSGRRLPPLVKGGQGRPPVEVRESGLIFALLMAAALGLLAAGVCWLVLS